MLRLLSPICFVALFCGVPAGSSRAGAFLLPQGQGQFIGGVGYSEGSRRFDQNGRAVAVPTDRKVDAGGYLEYGIASTLSLIAAPTLSHDYGSTPANSVTGSDSSAFGARLQIYGGAGSVVALQALVQPPIGDQSVASQLADGGARSFATDFRVMLGKSFPIFGMPAFVDVDPGVRVRADPFPDEARLDMAFGVRPTPRLMVLVQDFSAFAPSNGPLVARTGYSKAQASLVYDISPIWSVQAGAFHTVAGCNAVRETGPLAALWYRF